MTRSNGDGRSGVAFDEVETPVGYLLDSKYGQQVSIFGNESREDGRLIDPLVNQVCAEHQLQSPAGTGHLPFTGRKDSAKGRSP